jgi:Tol biopolymer transport system component
MLRDQRPSRYPAPAALVFSLLLIAAAWLVSVACDFCDPGQSPLSGVGPNVYWYFVDSIAACPAGDSLLINDVNHHHPRELRIEAWYDDINCNPKAGVPPESLWVTWSTATGNAVINDQGTAGTKIYADDTTDVCGHTRFTIPSLSGCGKIAVTFRVSGKNIGTKNVVVRSVDENASGRVTMDDWFGTCDVNYDGVLNSYDYNDVVKPHSDPAHWHRNALFGTPVRRTNANVTGFNHLGGDHCWSPTGKMLALSIFDENIACTINLLPSDPAVGNVPTRFTNPGGSHDYSPNWSPIGTPIYWNRDDLAMMYKGVFGYTTDTTTHTITINSPLSVMEEMSLSPDASTLAFHGYTTGGFRLFTVAVTGGTPVQVTADTAADDHSPQWSPDGKTLVFYRTCCGGAKRLYEVPATGVLASPRLVGIAGQADSPGYHPDGHVIVYALSASVPQAATLDTTVAIAPRGVVNYPEYTTQNFMLPKLSPDGTRLLMNADPPANPAGGRQLWAVRRNMNLPPTITAFAGQTLADTTVALSIYVVQGASFSVTMSATDPEGDPLTYGAYFLQTDLGMSFDPATRQFNWTPPANTVGQTFNVKFFVSTPSGGYDSFIAQFTVHQTSPQFRVQLERDIALHVVSRNPVQSSFEIGGDFARTGAHLDIYDVTGRKVASLTNVSASRISWNLTARGTRAARGMYFYRATCGGQLLSGRFVIVE